MSNPNSTNRGAGRFLRGRNRFGRNSVRLLLILLLIVPLATMAICTGWGLLEERTWTRGARAAHLESISMSTAGAVALLLEQNELNRVRSLVGEIVTKGHLERCTVELPDGQVIADSLPGRSLLQEMPQTWANGAAEATTQEKGAKLRTPIELKDRGRVYLTVTDTRSARWSVDGGQVELGAIWLGLVVSLLALYRRARVVLRPMQGVQESLLALAAGETSLAALTISPRWGAAAAAWNGLVSERAALRRAAQEQRGVNQAGAGRGIESTTERACDTLPVGMILIDTTMKVRYANGAAGTLLRCKRQELIGKPLPTTIGPKDVLELISSVVEKGAKRRGTIEVEQSPDGEKSVLRFNVMRMPPEGCGLGMVLIEDMTQQRIADQARDLFVTHATHELRTPLTNIRLYVEMLLEDNHLEPAERGKCINVINQEAGRLERMVGDMLSVAEIEAGSMKLNTDDVRMEPLLEELKADYVAQAAEKKIALAFELPPKLPVIRGDRDKIAMALHNLIGNALKYTPAEGNVKVKVDSNDASFIVRVEDSGIGIAPEETERIFEKFYRAKDRRVAKITGTGLGLALAREVVRMHGGDVTVESQLDRGSVFTLRLPATAPPAAKAA